MNISMKRAAIAQLCSTASKSSNLQNIAKCANMARMQGASMLFLPECFGFMGRSAKETLHNAESINITTVTTRTLNNNNNEHDHSDSNWLSDLEKIVETGECMYTKQEMIGADLESQSDSNSDSVSIIKGLCIIAAKSGLWISGGGIHEKGAPPCTGDESKCPRVYNTHIIIDSDGNVVTKYRKVHLFDVSIPSQGVNLRESATTAPGSKLVVCDSPIGKLGLSTCYDVRFPEMYTKLVEEGGADILLVPSAFTVPTGKAHWHTLLKGTNLINAHVLLLDMYQYLYVPLFLFFSDAFKSFAILFGNLARAIENQCYVLAAAQYGKHNEKRQSYGHSMAINPWGEVVEDAGGCDGPGTTSNSNSDDGTVFTPSIVICDIDVEKLKSIRERIPIRKHRAACTFSW